MTPAETTGLVAGIYAVARTIEEGFKKLFGSLERHRKEARRMRDEDQMAAQFTEIQRELKKISLGMVKMDLRGDDLLRRIEELERKFDKYVTSPHHEPRGRGDSHEPRGDSHGENH